MDNPRPSKARIIGCIAFFGFIPAMMLIGKLTAPAPEPVVATAPVTSSAAQRAAVPATATPYFTPAPRPAAGDRVTVSRVIDGDTFELADGRKVRVLGIDSCESNTPGGQQATAAAKSLEGGAVTLSTEPGVDTDRYGRLLRYVQTGTGDHGEYMVRFDHTGVYQGDNDASDAYIAKLYAHDLDYAANPPSGRECGGPVSKTAPKDDGPVYVPLPDNDDDSSWLGRKACSRTWLC